MRIGDTPAPPDPGRELYDLFAEAISGMSLAEKLAMASVFEGTTPVLWGQLSPTVRRLFHDIAEDFIGE